VFEINPDGTPIRKIVTVPGDFNFYDVIASKFYGVLLLTAPFCMNAHDVTCPGGIFFVDPTTGVFGQSASLSFVGGLQTDANDNVYLTFEGGATLSFLPDFITITNIFPLDGVTNSIVGTGSLSNHIFLIDGIFGELWEAKLDGSDLTMIASGEDQAFGDPTIDPHNGSLVVAATDSVVRISGGGLASADGETQVNSCP